LPQSSTGLRKYGQPNRTARARKHGLIVYTYDEAAKLIGVARRTLERLIALGEGPAVIELSPRRRGILESDLISWLHKHRRVSLREMTG
jgi:excisionase family DNA binding protein